jgi:hypothetical protein
MVGGEDGGEGADTFEAQDAAGLHGGLVDGRDCEARIMLCWVGEEALW